MTAVLLMAAGGFDERGSALAAGQSNGQGGGATGRMVPQLLGYKALDVSVSDPGHRQAFAAEVDRLKEAFAAAGIALRFAGVAAGSRRGACSPAVSAHFRFDDKGNATLVLCSGTFYSERAQQKDVPGALLLRRYLEATLTHRQAYNKNPEGYTATR